MLQKRVRTAEAKPTAPMIPEQFQIQPQRRNRVARSNDGLLNTLWVILGMMAALTIVAGYLYAFSDLILPGASVAGIDTAGLSLRDGKNALEEAWAAQRMGINVAGTRREIAPTDLGVRLDGWQTAQRLHAAGRSPDGLLAMLGLAEPRVVDPVLVMDRDAAVATLNGLAPAFSFPPTAASIEIVDGRAVITPPAPGQTLDVAATLALIHDNLPVIMLQPDLPLVTMPIPPAAATMPLDDVAAAVNRLLAAPLTVILYDPVTDQSGQWQIPPQVWGHWLDVTLGAQTEGGFDWSLEPERIQPFLDAQQGSLAPTQVVSAPEMATAVTEALRRGDYAAALRLYHTERRHTVQAGETLSSIAWRYGMPYPWLEAANPTLGDGLFAGQEILIPSPDAFLPLPVVRNKRMIVSLSQQRLWAYENGAILWEWPVSTGIDSSPTSPGIFQIQSHENNAYAGNWDLWMPYFMGIYQPVPGQAFMNGFHGFPTRDGSTLLWTDDLGHPVTFGCILLSNDNAALLYNWAESGVVVEVQP